MCLVGRPTQDGRAAGLDPADVLPDRRAQPDTFSKTGLSDDVTAARRVFPPGEGMDIVDENDQVP